MSTPSLAAEIYYPDSDGQPMAESPLHLDWMIRILDILRVRYAGQPVFVAGNMLLYYVEGNPSFCVAPDAFVVKGVEPVGQRSYQLWREGQPPCVVFETTSAATRNNDQNVKPGIYEKIGVAEYFLYDPTAEYLEPPLQGHRLTAQGYVRLEPNLDGKLESEELDVFLERDGLDLVFRDRRTGEVLGTGVELAQRETATIRREADRERTAKEAAQREAEARRQEAERERAAREAAEREAEARRQEAERERAEKDRERAAKEAAEQANAALSERIREMEQALARQRVAPPSPPNGPDAR